METHESPSVPQLEGGFYVGDRAFFYPTLLRRYQSLLVDFLLIFAVMIMAMAILNGSELRQPVMVSLGVLFVFVYEPVLTVYSSTIGQRVMGIRVRSIDDPEKSIKIFDAYARIIAKWMLGWLSFVTINFNRQHRAIHDMAGSSVVIKV